MREIKFRKLYGIAGLNETRWEYVGVNEFKGDRDDTSLSPWLEWTGLHDKNGKEIYEGDVLKNNRNNTSQVSWGEAGGCGCCDRDVAFGWFFEEGFYPDNVEIIGNIYENPELIPTPSS